MLAFALEMSDQRYDVVVVGGGIIGTATARALCRRYGASLLLLEAEDQLAAHQTGHNSGVIHSGLYYQPGSLKARNCAQGREAMYRFCEENEIIYEKCGKLVVATSPAGLPALDELERRGRANGLAELQRLTAEEIKEYEPHCRGVAGLRVPQTGIVDYGDVVAAYARSIQQRGGEIQTGSRLLACIRQGAEFVLETTRGAVRCAYLVNCAGLQSDRVARLCGVEPNIQILPFRGEYYTLRPEKHHLVQNLIYPVPDPRFPFLGVHFTRLVKGGVEAGPNAVLALKREGYTKLACSPRDVWTYVTYGGFWRMAGKYWRRGLGEVYRSFSKGAFVKALQRLVPELQRQDIQRGGAGVRAQALDPQGQLVDDFRIVEAERMVHVLNAPSPGATASLAIGAAIAAQAAKNFSLARAS